MDNFYLWLVPLCKHSYAYASTPSQTDCVGQEIRVRFLPSSIVRGQMHFTSEDSILMCVQNTMPLCHRQWELHYGIINWSSVAVQKFQTSKPEGYWSKWSWKDQKSLWPSTQKRATKSKTELRGIATTASPQKMMETEAISPNRVVMLPFIQCLPFHIDFFRKLIVAVGIHLDNSHFKVVCTKQQGATVAHPKSVTSCAMKKTAEGYYSLGMTACWKRWQWIEFWYGRKMMAHFQMVQLNCIVNQNALLVGSLVTRGVCSAKWHLIGCTRALI